MASVVQSVPSSFAKQSQMLSGLRYKPVTSDLTWKEEKGVGESLLTIWSDLPLDQLPQLYRAPASCSGCVEIGPALWVSSSYCLKRLLQ